MKNFAFTLSEVLITLAIIGIVAALTLPVVISKANERHLISLLKKNYSIFSNATNKIVADYGGDLSTAGISYDEDTLVNLYSPYLKIIKKCKYSSTARQICWHKDDDWKYLNGSQPTTYADLPAATSVFTLADGTIIRTYTFSNKCESGGVNTICAYLYLDLNGKKGPNTVGKDIFKLTLRNNRLEPYKDGTGCNKETSTGYDCIVNYILK